MKGKLILKQATDLKEGDKIIFDDKIYFIEVIYGRGRHPEIAISSRKNEGYEYILFSQPSQFHIEYDKPGCISYVIKESLPLSQSQYKEALELGEGAEVEFEIEEIYVEPPESIHCNRGGYDKFAKIKFKEPKQESWEEIIIEYVNSSVNKAPGITEWLKDNFNPPTRKEK